MKQFIKQPLIYLMLLIVSSTTGCAANRGISEAKEQPPSNVATQNTTATPSGYITQIVQQAGSAVVRIDSTRTVRQTPSQDPFFNRFFGQQLPLPSQQRVQRGTGSGFIVNADGRILTNAHVVANADSVAVVLKDGRRFDGQVVGTDPVTDVAVVKINANQLPTLKVGNSDNLLPGQAAIAIGNPLGLQNTVTQGIISATQRSSAEVGVPAERVDFIQTDAAINPGNSGGPLLNAQGEVIGINTAIIQGAQGLGFAIPINQAVNVAEQLVTKGRADHPYIGIQMAELNPDLRKEINQGDLGFKVNQDQGVLIVNVVSGSPAAQAGLQPGDLIERLNNQPIEKVEQVQNQVEAIGLGKASQMVVNRKGRSQTVTVRPVQLPPQKAVS
ncbi:trypsin-like peptidase domain-containing protein (plasmid) [Kovacikia minuta CCNUW1]|uniref:HhoA/HhoB/HtrA family serine endopeptidase n=1 Tax=Kovacikia minuta TaxID=2931930 RepID=UPI001CCEA8B6|nr:HhoA/HhoB/HtrA family serine endopeptidase [Kovacikia minuta]UBF30685.1 trypsin-like peptidase domain-containing protein [Kovacikia minuta CCNUW1]